MMISASMIVRNEEECITRCLKSIAGLDEIVILDTGSTDMTPEICLAYTNKVFAGEYAWNDNFAEARNESLKRCSGDWIFVIDADEILETGVPHLRRAVHSWHGEDVLMAKIRFGNTRFWSPRMFKNGIGIRWHGAIHNYLDRTGTRKTGVVIESGRSENHSKDPDRSLRILRKEINARPDCIREKYYLAREYYYRRDWAKAIQWFRSYLKARGSWAPERADAWCLLAKCYYQAGIVELAHHACFEALRINADFAEPMRMMAAMSGPKNRKKWTAFASQSRNEDVLFIRDLRAEEVLQ